jgi:hypothetical protein
MATFVDHDPRYVDRAHKTAIPVLGTAAVVLLMIVLTIGVLLSTPH